MGTCFSARTPSLVHEQQDRWSEIKCRINGAAQRDRGRAITASHQRPTVCVAALGPAIVQVDVRVSQLGYQIAGACDVDRALWRPARTIASAVSRIVFSSSVSMRSYLIYKATQQATTNHEFHPVVVRGSDLTLTTYPSAACARGCNRRISASSKM